MRIPKWGKKKTPTNDVVQETDNKAEDVSLTRVTDDADTLIAFGNTTLGIPFYAELDTEFDRVTLVSQSLMQPFQVTILALESQITYTVMNLSIGRAETFTSLRETIDNLETIQGELEQENS